VTAERLLQVLRGKFTAKRPRQGLRYTMPMAMLGQPFNLEIQRPSVSHQGIDEGKETFLTLKQQGSG
jgi:hypothetical protein